MNKSKLTFKRVYLIYLAVLVLLAGAALGYVYTLLRQYEASQPEQQVWKAVDQLAVQAADGTFLSLYDLPKATPGSFEKGRDLQKEYLALYGDREHLSVVRANGVSQGDTLEYQIESGGVVLARVGLKAEGPAVTKLAVFSMRDWAVDWVRPELEARDYTLTVPTSFSVTLNGTPLTGTEGDNGESTYTASGLYLPPDFSITDEAGTPARYTIRDGKVLAEYFNYTLTLPSSLTVQVNGETWSGESQGTDRVRYVITMLDKPTVTISDCYGNEMSYEGGNKLPLTSYTITADERYSVQVDGTPVPQEAVTLSPNPDYQHFADYVDNLPQVCVYSVAVLREDAQVTVTDGQGNPVALEEGTTTYDFTSPSGGLDEVPAEVSKQVDVLKVAQDWSLFMTNDLAFSKIKGYLISSSYQYEVALKYANGEDITFTSRHTLMNPAFTDSAVTNFHWITEDCFSVDIRFVKHMRLWYGTPVDDPMNDRFYFVRYDDTADDVDNPTWKLVSMKEILNHADE
ncbi:hypothetical protein DWX58_06810 [Pseudoflavonifractor sp. AF19-9AC]|uniref:hypothetical protein n=1 Tax=Pseudoflavonifractor sp. AF19-9AC TaxID=2292244 RepID=UPI000E4B82E3|nr:hypothetical protein [Pseudoflavonifractor sp. AF19-9AC]RHR10182.1 hypothetical protein DWX58_06810 [Pseudoflavonifractor sp. AF19-9AC]